MSEILHPLLPGEKLRRRVEAFPTFVTDSMGYFMFPGLATIFLP